MFASMVSFLDPLLSHELMNRSSVKSRKLSDSAKCGHQLISDSSTDTIMRINWSRLPKSSERMSFSLSELSVSNHGHELTLQP
jgi:hypothetical protein